MIDLDKIHKGMAVLTSDGDRLGIVQEVLGHMLFLDEVSASAPNQSVSIPMTWIVAIDQAIRLAKSREQLEKERSAGTKSNL